METFSSILTLSYILTISLEKIKIKILQYNQNVGAYEAVKLAHADWVKNHRDESDQFHYGYGALLSAALLLAKGFDKHQRDNINTWLWNYWEVQANQCNRA